MPDSVDFCPGYHVPASRQHFGYCFSDYIDLLTASHEIGMISPTELIATREQVAGIHLSLRNMDQIGLPTSVISITFLN